MSNRTVEDQLREEYFDLLPDIRRVLEHLEADPVLGERGETLAFKYRGFCEASSKVSCEYQITSVLTELFWTIEHSAIYKPSPQLKGVARSLTMRKLANRFRGAKCVRGGIRTSCAKRGIIWT